MRGSLVICHDLVKYMPDFSAQLIDDVVDFYVESIPLFTVYGYTIISASFVNNFKDALMHFKQLCDKYLEICESSNDEGSSQLRLYVILQFEMLLEHLNRAIVDVHIELLQGAIEFHTQIVNLLCSAKRIDEYSSYASNVNVQIGELKKYLLSLRIARMEIVRIASISDGAPVMNADCIKLLEAARSHVATCIRFILDNNDDELLSSVYYSVMEHNSTSRPRTLNVKI